MKKRSFFFALVVLSIASAPLHAAEPAKPNVLILLIDDMGWGQLGCYGGKLIPTPNIDALAAAGTRFTNGYVSACICSPSRVGLMTGRYQARTGHDANSLQRRPETELDLREVTLAQRMKTAGYTTGIVGKWHLGEGPGHLPIERGFDSAFGTLANLGEGPPPTFYRGKETIPDPAEAPVTTPIYREEALRFLEKNRTAPWFLYVAFNAIHAPHVATPQWLAKTAHLPERERKYAALIGEADDAVGAIMGKLRSLGLEENTLVFCISDNGTSPPTKAMETGGLRGYKWLVWEGGIRVPWIAQWKGRIPAGRVLDEPVIQLDVMPTALAAAGVKAAPEWQLDGVDLLPLLQNKTETLGREALYWRFGTQFAVRQGDWKLVKADVKMQPMLVNLRTDPGETTDLSAQEPARAKALLELWGRWNATMQPPRWPEPRWDGDDARDAFAKGRKNRKQEK